MVSIYFSLLEANFVTILHGMTGSGGISAVDIRHIDTC